MAAVIKGPNGKRQNADVCPSDRGEKTMGGKSLVLISQMLVTVFTTLQRQKSRNHESTGHWRLIEVARNGQAPSTSFGRTLQVPSKHDAN